MIYRIALIAVLIVLGSNSIAVSNDNQSQDTLLKILEDGGVHGINTKGNSLKDVPIFVKNFGQEEANSFDLNSIISSKVTILYFWSPPTVPYCMNDLPRLYKEFTILNQHLDIELITIGVGNAETWADPAAELTKRQDNSIPNEDFQFIKSLFNETPKRVKNFRISQNTELGISSKDTMYLAKEILKVIPCPSTNILDSKGRFIVNFFGWTWKSQELHTAATAINAIHDRLSAVEIKSLIKERIQERNILLDGN